jgi:hypothetical protein
MQHRTADGRLWDAGTGAAIWTLEGHWSTNQAVTPSSDSKVLVSVLGDGDGQVMGRRHKSSDSGLLEGSSL